MGAPSRLFAWSSLTALCVLSAVGGFLIGRLTMPSLDGVRVTTDVRPSVPIIRLERAVEGRLHGTMSGEVRLFIGEEPIVSGPTGGIASPVPPSFFSLGDEKNAKFVASTRGQTYYPISSKEAGSLSPTNRLYFPDRASAERAGFVPWDRPR